MLAQKEENSSVHQKQKKVEEDYIFNSDYVISKSVEILSDSMKILNENSIGSFKSYQLDINGMIIDYLLPLLKMNKFKIHQELVKLMENNDTSESFFQFIYQMLDSGKTQIDKQTVITKYKNRLSDQNFSNKAFMKKVKLCNNNN